MDSDSQVPAGCVLAFSAGRCALHGNLDPSADTFPGSPADITGKTLELRNEVRGQRWIISWGCDTRLALPQRF